MTCQECELKLGMDEDASDHLGECRECRHLAEEMRSNAVAMRDLRVRPRINWIWAAAVALIAVVISYRILGTGPEPRSLRSGLIADKGVKLNAEATRVPRAKRVQNASRRRTVSPDRKGGDLRVKMLTSDPDVVIYWIVDRKDGVE